MFIRQVAKVFLLVTDDNVYIMRIHAVLEAVDIIMENGKLTLSNCTRNFAIAKRSRSASF